MRLNFTNARRRLPLVSLVVASLSLSTGFAVEYMFKQKKPEKCLGVNSWEEPGRYRNQPIETYHVMTLEMYENLKSNPYIHITDVSTSEYR